jgi:acyl-coenzyme A synthetase/AMP-(fatty) acid ligase
VVIALPDGNESGGPNGRLWGVVVMVNPGLPPADVAYFLEYTRARVAVVHRDTAAPFRAAAAGAPLLKRILTVGDPDLEATLAAAPADLEAFPTHRYDPAIWLFSGGTTGRPKAVVQTHRSFANTTECYGRQVIGYTERDVTLSVPKLYFGYATGSNLFFPFAAGGSAALFPEPVTADVLFRRIAQFRPTVLINVPTMINKMVSHPDAGRQDLSSLRVCTSAGEALPVELYHRWKDTFGVELLDGLGTAEMWHIFVSNRPGAVRPGTLGTVVPGFEVKVCDEEGREVPRGEVGWLWVRGDSRATGYWQQMEKTTEGFRGECTPRRPDHDGCGRVRHLRGGGRDAQVSGKWPLPRKWKAACSVTPRWSRPRWWVWRMAAGW